MKEFLIGSAVAVLCLLAGFYAGSLQSVQPVQIGASTEHTNPETFYNKVTLSGVATTTRTGGNILINSTSTGLVLRATNGSCYLLTLAVTGGATPTIGTSTASCN